MTNIEKSEFIPTRRSLLSRLRDLGDQESWQDFFNTYWRLIYQTAFKAGLSDSESQEVVQETVIAVSKSMGDFRYNPNRGSFKQWLLKQTKWRIVDQFRKRTLAERDAVRFSDDLDTDQILDPSGSEFDEIWDREWDKNLLETALERLKKRVNPKQFQIFDLYVLREWPIAKVARNTGTNRMQIYYNKHRLNGFLRKEVLAIEAALP